MNSVYLSEFNWSEFNAAGNKAFIEDENIRIDYTNDKDVMKQDNYNEQFSIFNDQFNDQSESKLNVE